VSRLSDLLRQVGERDAELAAEIAAEVKALESRRAFGLNFERHTPESVELPGRPVRKGDKVRFLPERGATANLVDTGLWQVIGFRNGDEGRVALLARPSVDANEPEKAERPIDDLVVVAEFRDPIYPGLKSTGKVERGGDRPYHTVINAENYHALQALLYTHAGKVDAIYIDPPYNTGAKDWKYNNDYVDGEDAYRHSKWLAFMERRLKLAKRLLDPESSVLVVTIDEKEYLRLGLLLKQTFPESEVQMISSVINPKGAGGRYFSRVDEYVFVVFFGSATVREMTRGEGGKEIRWRYLRRTDIESRRGTTKGGKAQFYPIYVGNRTGRIEKIGEAIPHDFERNKVPSIDGCTAVFPIREDDGMEMNWGLTAPSLQRALDAGFVRVTKGKSQLQPYIFAYLPAPKIKKVELGEFIVAGKRDDGSKIIVAPSGKASRPTTSWREKSHDAGAHGTSLLRTMLKDRKFPFPKALYAVEDTLRLFAGAQPNAIIVDFFSGSGTTAHAVMRLNKQDGGRRQCISVTNNEVSADEQKALRDKGLRPGDPEWEQWGICDYITKPRIKAAITGRTPDGEPIKGDYKFTDEFPMADGFEENVEFFTMTYEAPRRVAHHRSFAAIAPLLWLKAGARGRRIEEAVDDFAVADAYGVLFDPDCSQSFVTALAEHPDARMAFIVTDDDRAYQSVCKGLPEAIEPVRLYASYLTSFTINTGRD